MNRLMLSLFFGASLMGFQASAMEDFSLDGLSSHHNLVVAQHAPALYTAGMTPEDKTRIWISLGNLSPESIPVVTNLALTFVTGNMAVDDRIHILETLGDIPPHLMYTFAQYAQNPFINNMNAGGGSSVIAD